MPFRLFPLSLFVLRVLVADDEDAVLAADGLSIVVSANISFLGVVWCGVVWCERTGQSYGASTRTTDDDDDDAGIDRSEKKNTYLAAFT